MNVNDYFMQKTMRWWNYEIYKKVSSKNNH